MPYSPDGRLISNSQARSAMIDGMLKAAKTSYAKAPKDPLVLKTFEEFVGPGISKKVLVIRNGGLGDVLCVTPLIRHLSQKLHLSVDVMTDYPEVFECNRYVNQVFKMDYDYVHGATSSSSSSPVIPIYDGFIDLCGYAERPENLLQHRPIAFAASVEIDLDGDYGLDLFLSPEETQWAAEKLSDYPYTACPPPIAYVWRSTTDNRNWSIATHARVMGELVRAGYTLVLLDKDSIPIPSNIHLINLTGSLSIRQTAAIISRCSAVITPDTGSFHIASALEKPIFTYFGAFPAEERATTPIQLLNNPDEGCVLYPCRNYSCPFFEVGQSPCLNVNEKEVLEAVRQYVQIPKYH